MRKKPYSRADRLGRQIGRALGDLLLAGAVHEPATRLVTVTYVGMSKDLRVANVHVQCGGTPAQGRKAVDGLRRAAGFLRRKLAPQLNTRVIPELRFELDESLDEMARVSELLANVTYSAEGAGEEE